MLEQKGKVSEGKEEQYQRKGWGKRGRGMSMVGSRSEHMIKIDTIRWTGHFLGPSDSVRVLCVRLRRGCHEGGGGLRLLGHCWGSKKASPAFWPVIKMSLH